MKQRTFAFGLLVFVSSMLVGCAPAGQGIVPKPPYVPELADDFGFKFEESSCYTEILDTFSGTFTTAIGDDPSESIDVSLRLSNDQMKAVFDKMIEISYFSYPEIFEVPTPKSGEMAMVSPAMHFHLAVRNGGVDKSVDWLIQSKLPKNHREITQLLGLIQMIRDMIKSSPEYKQLPERGFGCL